MTARVPPIWKSIAPHLGYFVPRLYVPQAAVVGIAAELTRLKSALGGLGSISGIRPAKGSRKPYRRWRVSAVIDVQLGLHLSWPFIGRVKRAQAQIVLQTMHSQPDLPRGNPAFGVAGARDCLRGTTSGTHAFDRSKDAGK